LEGYCSFAHSAFGFFQGGKTGVGVSPQREKIFVPGERMREGGVGICYL